MRTKISIYLFLVLSVIFADSCTKDSTAEIWPKGKYNQAAIQNINGFFEQRADLLSLASLQLQEFIVLSTDSAWHLVAADMVKLRKVRDGISFPTSSTLLQKVIPLEDVALYMNNTYGGTVGGFVSAAGDVKSLKTLNDVFYGMRLNYTGTKFLAGGGGYAVLRFTSNVTGKLSIPYCKEMGGTRTHSWPNTGGGFTSSTLGNGGFPEYTYDSYYAPNQGGELYEITPAGNEIMRAQYNGTKWVTTEPATKSVKMVSLNEQVENPIRNGIYARTKGGALLPAISLEGGSWQIIVDGKTSLAAQSDLLTIITLADFRGDTFQVRGFDGKNYYLTTTDAVAYHKYALEIVEKGLYGITVPITEVNKIREVISNGI
jgi:hypothetical protein